MITSGTLGGPIRAGDDDGQRGKLMFIKHKSAFSRRDAPKLCVNLWPRKLEGAGNALPQSLLKIVRYGPNEVKISPKSRRSCLLS
jgi:hypothetical protein